MSTTLGEVVWMPRQKLQLVTHDARRWSPLETGGVLMGYRAGSDVVVQDVVDAGPLAIRSRHSFLPDQESQLSGIADLYERSGRITTYLGDWHSHPTGEVRMSRTDERTLIRIAASIEARTPEPLMMIVRGEEYRVWQASLRPGWWRRRVFVLREMKVRVYE
jgi:integrative and conjugative element protein (TIGR02256 family)